MAEEGMNFDRYHAVMGNASLKEECKIEGKLIANSLESSTFPFSIRTFKPGTIVFANEPFADITGPFALTQMMEVDFEHAFDEPITVASNALRMRLAAGSRHLSDFSLRRNGESGRGLEV